MTPVFTRRMGRVARMEFKLTAENKAFVIITIIGPFLIVAMSVLPGLLASRGGGAPAFDLGIVGGSPAFTESMRGALGSTSISVTAHSDREDELRGRLAAGELDGYIVIPTNVLDTSVVRFVTSSGPNFEIVGTIEGVVGSLVVAMRLANAGFDPGEVAALSQRPSLEYRRFEAGRDDSEGPDMMSMLFTTLAFTMLLYMTILLYGQSLGTSVLNEKRSKMVEVILSSISARELLVGKILGKAAASLLQYGIWIVMALLFLNIIGPAVNVEVSLAGGVRTYAYLVLFFLLAFFLYASFYAALGAASEDEQHLSQLGWPVILFLVLPMVMIGVLSSNPDGGLAVGLSIFPLTAPIVMFQRLLVGSPPVWQVALSIGLLLVTIAAVSLMAAKIFRIGILMTGKRFTLSEVTRWLRYRE
ncbi:MAG: ABC transporter permease [Spirochaetaceae bacterium]|nr:MAG: ABC transporter permease [Spirochaetaceae bacterium]